MVKNVLVVLAVVLAGALMAHRDAMDEPEALCGTDTECMELCPPPSDDDELCDGGPQS